MNRDEFNAAVRSALDGIDGSTASAVSVLTGLSRERLEELGGFDEDGAA